jgi:hypothetical protein
VTAMSRTIIDILRKGNQELFHSSIIAWLLEPNGEHGYGNGFLNAFAEAVEQNGYPKFRAALQASPTVIIKTEAATKMGRYDIKLEIGSTFVVIENKTKSLGDDPQFEKYKGENTVLVALGMCDFSFSEQVKGKYPLVTYADVLSILDRLPEPPASDFKVLVDHYRQFLRRELAVLAEIDQWYMTGEPGHASTILEQAEVAAYTENDRRFLNLYLLERLRRDLFGSPRWKHCGMMKNKNQQSGVWLAVSNLDKEAGIFRYEDALAPICKDQAASIWFHVELWDGVFAKDGESTAGVIQLRVGAKDAKDKTFDAKTFVEGFRRIRPLRDGEKYANRMKKEAGSIYLLARPLLKKHLTASQFKAQLEGFAESLGKFR